MSKQKLKKTIKLQDCSKTLPDKDILLNCKLVLVPEYQKYASKVLITNHIAFFYARQESKSNRNICLKMNASTNWTKTNRHHPHLQILLS